ncbi:MAG TPA: hypothetical protein VJ623_13130 [Holophagaceae bacterium]|nr:hypothetical protein [Holophagaceae bacterium]
MGIRWKSRKGLNPDLILERLSKSVVRTHPNRISYTDFTFSELMPAIFSMLQFDKDISWEIRNNLVSTTIHQCASDGTLNAKSFEKYINIEFSKYKETKFIDYYLLIPISITGNLPHKRLIINNLDIQIFTDKIPKKFQTRSMLEKAWDRNHEHTPNSYSMACIKTTGRSQFDAVHLGLNTFDQYRAILNLLLNSTLELYGDNWEPINKVRLGGMYSLHHLNGKLAGETYWFDPECHISKAHFVDENKKRYLIKNYSIINSMLLQSRYVDILSECMCRYTRALDSPNPSNALHKLWATLESLGAPNESNNEKLISRIVFLFEDSKYHKQILEHLRETRNTYIHQGEEPLDTKTHCFQLQFYFHTFLLFHIKNFRTFNSHGEANSYLDLGVDLGRLRRSKELIEKAIEFRKKSKLASSIEPNN